MNDIIDNKRRYRATLRNTLPPPLGWDIIKLDAVSDEEADAWYNG